MVPSATCSTRAYSQLIKEQPQSIHGVWSTVGSRGNSQPSAIDTNRQTSCLFADSSQRRPLPLFFPSHHHHQTTKLKHHAAKTKEKATPRKGFQHEPTISPTVRYSVKVDRHPSPRMPPFVPDFALFFYLFLYICRCPWFYL